MSLTHLVTPLVGFLLSGQTGAVKPALGLFPLHSTHTSATRSSDDHLSGPWTSLPNPPTGPTNPA